jgi:hypothetical protein
VQRYSFQPCVVLVHLLIAVRRRMVRDMQWPIANGGCLEWRWTSNSKSPPPAASPSNKPAPGLNERKRCRRYRLRLNPRMGATPEDATQWPFDQLCMMSPKLPKLPEDRGAISDFYAAPVFRLSPSPSPLPDNWWKGRRGLRWRGGNYNRHFFVTSFRCSQ